MEEVVCKEEGECKEKGCCKADVGCNNVVEGMEEGGLLWIVKEGGGEKNCKLTLLNMANDLCFTRIH